jgi:hypothetical protein
VASGRDCGASGYTIVRARGAGSSGEQSGMLNFDAHIKFRVIVPPERLLRKGCHLTVYVSDVSVLGPDKFQSP